jgi:hypothetical protein
LIVTRYVLMTGDRWVTAVYGPGNGVGFTQTKEDASSWVTYECAVAAAKVVMRQVDTPVFVHSVEEPAFPRSWN